MRGLVITALWLGVIIGPRPVEIRFLHRILKAPAQGLEIKVRVEPTEGNRRVDLAAVCDGMIVSAGYKEITEETTWATFTKWNLDEPCEYTLEAVLLRADPTTKTGYRTFHDTTTVSVRGINTP